MQNSSLPSLRSVLQLCVVPQRWYACTYPSTYSTPNADHVLRRSCASSAQSADSADVTLDSSAVQRLKELVKETPGQFLRVSVDPGGCSGFQYVFGLDEKINDDDLKFSQDGVSLAVDKVSMEFLKGSTIEFAEDLIASSFRVKDNPNSEQACGCGSSFAAKME